MADITPEQLDQFFEPLVGAPGALEDFATALTNATQYTPDGSFFATNPYDRLEGGLHYCLATAGRNVEDPTVASDLVRASSISANILVDTVETIGKLYRHNAVEPQRRANVESNVNRIIGNVASMAYGDQNTGVINRASWYIGKDPNRPRSLLASRWQFVTARLRRKKEAMSPQSFVVSSDSQGQLDVRFRYPMLRPLPKSTRCPAVISKAEQDGKVRPALSVFSDVIGSVALNEIYPRLIEIVD